MSADAHAEAAALPGGDLGGLVPQGGPEKKVKLGFIPEGAEKKEEKK